jgi:hypothetical protein
MRASAKPGHSAPRERRAAAKQEHTAKQIFERLKEEHGFTGDYTIVKGSRDSSMSALRHISRHSRFSL